MASDIVVPDDAEFRAVSSRHVLVECTSDDVYLTDVSTNGTFRASGARLTKRERTKIAPGENIFLGAASGSPMIRVERV
ncbi:hypothetical protein AXK61_14470 [Tsukamurella pseudospumae]|uniref:FHA domain-containing protein n=1 Tax=Tsukamurella pseudospumae TaxID=239498 RepID=A0A137ZRB7_9ACTN|nr:hypothetical protein AXK61_14470 [Tsukamurella pseudospumae]